MVAHNRFKSILPFDLFYAALEDGTNRPIMNIQREGPVQDRPLENILGAEN